MKYLKQLCFLLFILFFLSNASAQETTCVYFFYGNGCPHCAQVMPLIEQISNNKSIEMHKFEVYDNRTNLILLNKYFSELNLSDSQKGVPFLIIGNNVLVGDVVIGGNIEKLINENIGASCPILHSEINNSENNLSSLSLLTIIGAALVDSINPCAIAVLLILMGALLVSGDKKKSLKAGLAFTLSIYISYFLFGLGLFSAIQVSGLSYWFYKIIGVVAIIIGLANIKDFFYYGGGGFVMEIPRRWRPKLKELLGKVTSPLGAFFIGFVVCLFELPCTGGPYIVILGLLADRMTLYSSIPLLILYNLVFVLPLILLTFLIFFGFANVEKATKWKDNNLRLLHLIAGLIMLVLGILIAFGLV